MTYSDSLPEGATPIDQEEAEGLIPGLTTRAELNAFEQQNIARAVLWSRTSKRLKKSLIQIDSLKLLHKRMFDQTWKWAGKFRSSGKNIGVDAIQIQPQLHSLCGDFEYWVRNEYYSIEECAIRFHHRLVSIHPFPNGNGRHARLASDLVLFYADKKPFSWGGNSLDVEGKTRSEYISALQRADRGDYSQLLKFAQQSDS